MRKKSFQRAFTLRSGETVQLLLSLPLTDATRPALESAARRAYMDALLAANFDLVQACHDIAVLASTAAGPGIPEGPARLRFLRAALRRASEAAGLREGASPLQDRPDREGFPGGVCRGTSLVNGRLPVSREFLERAQSLGTGLRLLRFYPSDLRKAPGDLSEKLVDLESRGIILALYALVGRREGAAANEFALFVSDRPFGSQAGADSDDPFSGLPVTGRIRTILSQAEGTPPDTRGLELVDVLPSYLERGNPYAPAGVYPESSPPQEAEAGLRGPRTGLAPEGGVAKFPTGGFAERAVREGARLDGEIRNVTSLFIDILSVSSLIRGGDPQRSMESLNGLLSRMIRCVESRDGVVDALVGSTLYAFWGAPAATGRDACLAVDAALAMRKAVLAFNREQLDSGGSAVRMECGLDSGPVWAGRLGMPRRLSYTVAGDAPQRACRIGLMNESLGTDILLSDYTLRLMGGSYRTFPMETPFRTGKGEAIRLYALLGRRGDRAAPRDPRDLQGTG